MVISQLRIYISIYIESCFIIRSINLSFTNYATIGQGYDLRSMNTFRQTFFEPQRIYLVFDKVTQGYPRTKIKYLPEDIHNFISYACCGNNYVRRKIHRL